MSTLLSRVRAGLFIAVAGLLCLTLIAPALTLASTDLTAGEDAVVANTNGDGATLRTDPGRDAAAITNVPEGTPLEISAGVVPAPDGSLWYQVVVDGVPGFISSDFVERGSAAEAAEPETADDTTEESTTEETSTEPETTSSEATESESVQDEPAVQGPAAATIPWQQPVAVGIVVNTTGTLPVDGITCRADAADGAPVITELWEGNALEITGEQVFDGAGGGWYPINCAGVGGFVSAAYVALDAPVVDETVTEEPVTTEVGEEPVTEEVTEEPVVEEPVTEEPVTTEVVEHVVTEETAPVDEATTEDVVTEVVTEDVVEGPPAPVQETVTETEPAVAEDVVTETETATDTSSEAASDIESPVDEDVVTDTTTEPETAAETDTTTETATTTETETEATSETETTPVEETVEASTETDTERSTETEPVTETETSTDTATDETQAVTETVEPTEEPTEEATAPATEVATETPATPAPTPAFDESKAIGSAEVQGTNGAGLKCHTAADAGSPTITVLPEGANVIVMARPSGDWVSIVCGDRLGFAQVRYVYSGGAAPSDFAAEDTGGRVRVEGTGGGGLNCRASASMTGARITLVPEGSSLTIRGVPQGSWLPVVCGGRNGYVYVDYVSAPISGGSTSTTGPAFTTSTSGSATVANTGGDGVRCRTSASSMGSIITVLGEGSRVTLRGTPSNGWAPVVCAGRNGFVSSMYLKIVSSNGSTSGGSTSGTATVTGTGGGLNCRAGAGTQYRVITVLRDNSTVTLRGAASNGWQPVVCGGQNGFVSAQYLRIGSTSGGTSGGSSAGAGDWAMVRGTGGSGVYCRTRTTTLGANIMVVREGQRVQLRGTPSRGWAPVVCGGRNGYIALQYLSIGSTPTTPASPPPTNGGTTGLVTGDRARVTSNLNLRYAASTGSGVAAVAPAGTVVLIKGSATNGYYPVDWDGLRGYMSGQYLTKTTAALSERGGSGSETPPTSGGSPPGGGSSASGNAIASYAMGYQGYPYRWATHGPSSFDCSGFTYWVIYNVTGKNIWYGLYTQLSAGTPVSRSNLQPGDLVFFQNTYKAGVSHVGIYIGNNKFIHAQNESTGVVISDLDSSYYGPRWYGGVRIT